MVKADNRMLSVFKSEVGNKFQLYNSLFTSLPFHKVERTGILLSMFLAHCEDGFGNGKSPEEIVNSFFDQYTSYKDDKNRNDLLFRFIQYTERQVVLFDALEDAAFSQVNDTNGPGTMRHLWSDVAVNDKYEELKEVVKKFSVRLVLTAHPTQFYPSSVLGIIHDLAKALQADNSAVINSYLQQLGITPFLKKERPTPFDEAKSLIWFLQNTFYPAVGKIYTSLKQHFPEILDLHNPVVRLGFWPGGDRDGNPFVKADTTLKVADELRTAIVVSYYREVRRLSRRLTFKNVAAPLKALEEKLYNNIFVPGHEADISKEEIVDTLLSIKQVLEDRYNGFFATEVDALIAQVEVFGLYFATLDIRQDSSVHMEILQQVAEKTDALPENYNDLSDKEKADLLLSISKEVSPSDFSDELHEDTIKTMHAVKTIQQINGEEGCHRYIISHSTKALSVLEAYGLFLLSGWKKEELNIDIVPLFETIDDLKAAPAVMEELYTTEGYKSHLKRRRNIQTIMLGFSDGTKDGGYLMANYSIYKAKKELTEISRKYDVEVVFFDGRGGPPARGGGKTHQFYASMGGDIENKEIQLTIQGQTISSNFGNSDSAQYNLEQLLHAGINNALFRNNDVTLTDEDAVTLQELSEESYNAFKELKHNEDFLDYLNYFSPLRYYAEANIASRPSKRNKDKKLSLDDLRAVPYVGSWSQIKQNLPGFYGVGSALDKFKKQGKWDKVVQLYKNSAYFRALIGNCEMAMTKAFFPLTQSFGKHEKYGYLWNDFHDEYQRTIKLVLELTGEEELMDNKPVDKLSIQMRQRIELPLTTIQQFALAKIRQADEQESIANLKEVYERMVIRCSFGIINAERNSA
ncbi:phosphoenolpyruvate carboxylase [Cytophagaceae bacterium ABcell3]|nr:phosphoenolpyruvate carboxylase [Cytophagaceae bacterium ABcell3]